MKHLLIILSILLLSSPVIGDNDKGEILYFWETSSGYVGKGFGDKDFHPKYKGEWKGWKKNGQGTFTYYDGDKYVGEFKDDEPWNWTTYDKNGNIFLKYVNGK